MHCSVAASTQNMVGVMWDRGGGGLGVGGAESRIQPPPSLSLLKAKLSCLSLAH